MADRLAERTAIRRHRARVRVWQLVVAAVVVATAAWVVLFSPLFGVERENIEVVGAGQYTDLGAVDQEMDTLAGMSLARMDTLALRERLMKVPGVADAKITRVWPDGLRVELTARVPVAAVPQGAGGFALVDGDGVEVTAVTEPPAGLPTVQVALAAGPRPLRAALVILNALPTELRSQVASVAAPTLDSVRMTMVDGAVVDWGGPEKAALKIRVFLELRKLPQHSGVRYFDLSSPTSPVTR